MNRYESHVFKRAGFGAGDLRRLSRPGQVALRRLLFEHLLQAYRDASWEWGNVEATRDRLFCFAREEEHKDLFVGPRARPPAATGPPLFVRELRRVSHPLEGHPQEDPRVAGLLAAFVQVISERRTRCP